MRTLLLDETTTKHHPHRPETDEPSPPRRLRRTLFDLQRKLGGVSFDCISMDPRQLGEVCGSRILKRMIGGHLREPDVGYISDAQIPVPYPKNAGPCPDLCVEVFSDSNTRAEMQRKRSEYFASGCRLVWEIEPVEMIFEVFTGVNDGTVLNASFMVHGGDVLPGFEIPLNELFRRCRGKVFPKPATPEGA